MLSFSLLVVSMLVIYKIPPKENKKQKQLLEQQIQIEKSVEKTVDTADHNRYNGDKSESKTYSSFTKYFNKFIFC